MCSGINFCTALSKLPEYGPCRGSFLAQGLCRQGWKVRAPVYAQHCMALMRGSASGPAGPCWAELLSKQQPLTAWAYFLQVTADCSTDSLLLRTTLFFGPATSNCTLTGCSSAQHVRMPTAGN